jgi:zinc transport system ATP-binding protein
MGLIHIDDAGNAAQQRRKALAALAQVEMADFAQRRIGSLSGGQRQRVFIARALVAEPRLLLLDEPTASIDSKGQTDFYRNLRELNESITILVVSHDLMAISTYIKSVACVNKGLHHHHQAEITAEMFDTMYPGTADEACPIELVTHGVVPHRVLKEHPREP